MYISFSCGSGNFHEQWSISIDSLFIHYIVLTSCQFEDASANSLCGNLMFVIREEIIVIL